MDTPRLPPPRARAHTMRKACAAHAQTVRIRAQACEKNKFGTAHG
jgi:hypothetical protein